METLAFLSKPALEVLQIIHSILRQQMTALIQLLNNYLQWRNTGQGTRQVFR